MENELIILKDKHGEDTEVVISDAGAKYFKYYLDIHIQGKVVKTPRYILLEGNNKQ